MKTTIDIIQAVICVFLVINIGIMIGLAIARIGRGSRRDAEKVVRKALRMKLLAGRDLCKYALYVSPAGFKVALARDHYLALLTGMNDFWNIIPEGSDRDVYLAASELERHLDDGERRLAAIYDGYGYTLVTGCGCVVPYGYTCLRPSPEEIREVIREVIRDAKGKAGGRKRDRRPVHN